MSWDEALEALDWSSSMGRSVGALRLMFCHWLQPGMCALSLYAYWYEIGATQQKLGLVVAAREALYPLLTLVALWVKPIFLLANLSSPKNRVESFLFYVAMPEKNVLFCATGNDRGLPRCLFIPCSSSCRPRTCAAPPRSTWARSRARCRPRSPSATLSPRSDGWRLQRRREASANEHVVCLL